LLKNNSAIRKDIDKILEMKLLGKCFCDSFKLWSKTDFFYRS